jgi:hypothetical protein
MFNFDISLFELVNFEYIKNILIGNFRNFKYQNRDISAGFDDKGNEKIDELIDRHIYRPPEI